MGMLPPPPRLEKAKKQTARAKATTATAAAQIAALLLRKYPTEFVAEEMMPAAGEMDNPLGAVSRRT